MTNFTNVGRYVLPEDPAFAFLKEKAEKVWPDKIGEMLPSYFPKAGDEILFFSINSGIKNLEQLDVMKLECPSVMGIEKKMKEENNLFFSNHLGLLIAEDLILEKKIILPDRYRFLIGPDHKKHLHTISGYGHVIPYSEICCIESGKMFYGWHTRSMSVEPDEIVVMIRSANTSNLLRA